MTHRLHVATLGAAVGEIVFDSLDDNDGFQYDDAWARSTAGYYLAPAREVPKVAPSLFDGMASLAT